MPGQAVQHAIHELRLLIAKEGGCDIHNPGYDFNDDAAPWGASFFVRAVEARLRAA